MEQRLLDTNSPSACQQNSPPFKKQYTQRKKCKYCDWIFNRYKSFLANSYFNQLTTW